MLLSMVPYLSPTVGDAYTVRRSAPVRYDEFPVESRMRFWIVPIMLSLVGCATGPATLPQQMSAPVAECRWESSLAGTEANRRVVEMLEHRGFTIRDTDSQLGLVSAERRQTVHGYDRYYDDGWPAAGWYGRHAFGIGHRGGGSGVVIGFNQPIGGGNAERLERVSVLTDGEWLRVTRDVQIVDIDGVAREGRSASTEEFCRELRSDMESHTAGDAP